MAHWKSPWSKFWQYWLPVLLYIVVIFAVSSISGFHAPSGFSSVDKVAHILEYSILAFLIIRACKGSGLVASNSVAVLFAVVVGLTVGLSDELFQATVPGRMSDPADYAADAAGLALGGLGRHDALREEPYLRPPHADLQGLRKPTITIPD